LSWGTLKSVLKAAFWMNLGASLLAVAFAGLSDLNAIDLAMWPLFIILCFIYPFFLFLEAVSIPSISIYVLIAVSFVTPFTVFLALKFRSFWMRMLIGAGAVYLTLAVFSIMFMPEFKKAVAIEVDRQNVECVYFVPTFTHLLKNYVRGGGTSYAHVFALKGGSKYLWSFEAMAFVDVWEEKTADRHGGCYHLLKDAPK
jgi:hypothetical protein